jgi:probable rRNA maturation factor
MTSSGSTLLFGAIPADLKPKPAEKRALTQFVHALCLRLAEGRPLICLLANDAHLQQLNRDFLGHDYPTDVLSFPTTALKPELGEIAISLERAAAQAAEFGHTWLEEVKILLLHGTLHLLGYDHERGDTTMAREEKRWRSEFNLPETLIARADRAGKRGVKQSKRGAA